MVGETVATFFKSTKGVYSAGVVGDHESVHLLSLFYNIPPCIKKNPKSIMHLEIYGYLIRERVRMYVFIFCGLI